MYKHTLSRQSCTKNSLAFFSNDHPTTIYGTDYACKKQKHVSLIKILMYMYIFVHMPIYISIAKYIYL
jgi:hypothetical protein